MELTDLKIRTEDFNLVAKKPVLLNKLRKLTLHGRSGMNHELDHLIDDAKIRNVNAKVLLAYYKRELIGWALLSREKSDFNFPRSYYGFNPVDGVLFEVFVDHLHRRKGIGSALMKKARQKAGPLKLCVVPWDYQSERFYMNFKHYKNIEI
jgi:GNAT superfamily N-acetyltransferase